MQCAYAVLVICGLPCSNIFPYNLIKSTIFEKKLLNTKCVFWFSLQRLSETVLILRRSERHIFKNIYCIHVKHRLYLSEFKETWLFSTDFRKNTQISNFMKIRLVRAELFHSGKRTDKYDEASSRFFQVCESVYKAITSSHAGGTKDFSLNVQTSSGSRQNHLFSGCHCSLRRVGGREEGL